MYVLYLMSMQIYMLNRDTNNLMYKDAYTCSMLTYGHILMTVETLSKVNGIYVVFNKIIKNN